MITADGDVPAELSKLEKGYELLGELSRDEMVTVYVARDRLSGNEVAIKVLRAKDARGREALAHYASDARLLTALEHPNIVGVHAVKWLSENVLAVITERVRGPSLRQVLDVAGTLPVARATEVLKGLARALVWAHSSQIMHRDVRPENVTFEDGTGRVVLSDFGLARRIDLISGDPAVDAYRAPELADGRYPDRRTDVYSLGIVGWELLTGRRPWPDKMEPIPPRQRAPEPPPLATVRAGLPPALVSAIEGAVQLDRDRRIPDVTAFIDRLTGVAPPPRPKPEEETEAEELLVEPSEWVALPVPKLPQRPRAAAADSRVEAESGREEREFELKAHREVEHSAPSAALGTGPAKRPADAEVVGDAAAEAAVPTAEPATGRTPDREIVSAAEREIKPGPTQRESARVADAKRRKSSKGEGVASRARPIQADKAELASTDAPPAEPLPADTLRAETPRPESARLESPAPATGTVGPGGRAERPREESRHPTTSEPPQTGEQVREASPSGWVAAAVAGGAAAAAAAGTAPGAPGAPAAPAASAAPGAPAAPRGPWGAVPTVPPATPPDVNRIEAPGMATRSERIGTQEPPSERAAPRPVEPAKAHAAPARGEPQSTPPEPLQEPISGPISGPVSGPAAGTIGGPLGGVFGGPFGVPPIDGPTRRAEGMRGGLGRPRAVWGETHRADPARAQPPLPPLDPVFDTPAEFPLPVMPDPRPMLPDAGAVGGATRWRWTRRGVAMAATAVILVAAAIAIATMERAPDTTAGLMRPETPADYAGDVALEAKVDSAAPTGPATARPGVAPRDSEPPARRATSPARRPAAAQPNAPSARQPVTRPDATSPSPPAERSGTTAPATRGAPIGVRPETPASGSRAGGTTSAAPPGGAARPPATRTPSVAVTPAPSTADRSASPAPCSSPALADQRACLAAHVDRSDARLNEIYSDVITAMRTRANSAPGDPDPPEVQRLRAAQRRWLARRDADCRRRGRGREGPLWATPRARCLEEFSGDRARELTATLGRLRRD